MRVAVTGASGFMGGAVARELAVKGHTVFTFGRRHVDALEEALPNYSQWDLDTGSAEVAEVDAVIHCAAKVGDWGPEAGYRRVNVDGTRAVMETFAEVERFIHVSSASVYSGNQTLCNVPETASVGSDLHNAYARSKAEAEQLVLGSERNAVILRPHIVYGPGDTTLMPRLLAARRLGWLPVPGNGRNLLSVTHISNFVEAVERVLDSSVVRGVFNIADPETISVDELLRTVLQQNDADARLLYIPRAVAWAIAVMSEGVGTLFNSQGAPRLTRYLVAHIADENTLDLSNAFELLGYAPRYSVHGGPAQEENS